MKWETEKQKEAETTDTTPTEGTRFSAKGYNPIAEKEVENVILKDETNKKLPTSRKEAFDYIPVDTFYDMLLAAVTGANNARYSGNDP